MSGKVSGPPQRGKNPPRPLTSAHHCCDPWSEWGPGGGRGRRGGVGRSEGVGLGGRRSGVGRGVGRLEVGWGSGGGRILRTYKVKTNTHATINVLVAALRTVRRLTGGPRGFSAYMALGPTFWDFAESHRWKLGCFFGGFGAFRPPNSAKLFLVGPITAP